LEEVTTSDYNVNVNEDDELAGYIQRYPKFKNGNSWGLKLDLKIDAQPDSQMELRDKLYDDPNEGTGMQMFTEALMQLNECSKLFYEVKKESADIEERLYKLENIVTGVDTMYGMIEDVAILKNKFELLQPVINSLEGKIGDVENRVSKYEINMGHLINRVSKYEINMGYLNKDIETLKKDIETLKQKPM
jgi:DNA repair ATPase RecN